MKARLIALLSLVLAVALLAGGLPAMAGQATAVELNVTQADAGRQIILDKAHVLVLNLDANPSTGYSWQVVGEQKVLRQVGDFAVKPTKLLGAPTQQVIRFQAVASGQTTLNLVYRRPWETVEPAKTFSIQVVAKGPLALPYTPTAVDATVAAQDLNAAPAPTLPTVYNWCSSGYCTGVRDQGSCGSCWAFGTVGAFEMALKIKGLTTDLSEQYLVSCNAEGWGCNGGWWAHDYHLSKYIVGEPGPGAVYESDFRYAARDLACNPPHTHHEKISKWAYVGGSNSVPKVDSLRAAIYNYGPVSAAVYVGTAFQAYTSGIFTTSQTGSVNHAIVLTGWDNTNQYWNLRNSWGNSWGESGYMRIKYGTSNVGYSATYVVYP